MSKELLKEVSRLLRDPRAHSAAAVDALLAKLDKEIDKKEEPTITLRHSHFPAGSYREVGMRESLGGSRNLGIWLFVALPGQEPLTNEQCRELGVNIDEIFNKIMLMKISSDPKMIEQKAENRRKLIELFGDHKIFAEDIPNEYRAYWSSPWLQVTTPVGRIKIGWRKKVISIDYSDTQVEQDAKTLFPDEETTRFEKTIHAWGWDKAREYLNTILTITKV